jgi:ABC-type transporter Mla subunit MlaD
MTYRPPAVMMNRIRKRSSQVLAIAFCALLGVVLWSRFNDGGSAMQPQAAARAAGRGMVFIRHELAVTAKTVLGCERAPANQQLRCVTRADTTLATAYGEFENFIASLNVSGEQAQAAREDLQEAANQTAMALSRLGEARTIDEFKELAAGGSATADALQVQDSFQQFTYLLSRES